MTKILWEAGAENLPNDRGYLPETWVACAESFRSLSKHLGGDEDLSRES